MTDPVKSVASSPSSTEDRRGDGGNPATPVTTMASPVSTVQPSPVATAQQPLRLVVEPTNGGEDFTYKLFDRATGELLMELPREQAAKMSQSPDYVAGQVINAKA